MLPFRGCIFEPWDFQSLRNPQQNCRLSLLQNSPCSPPTCQRHKNLKVNGLTGLPDEWWQQEKPSVIPALRRKPCPSICWGPGGCLWTFVPPDRTLPAPPPFQGTQHTQPSSDVPTSASSCQGMAPGQTGAKLWCSNSKGRLLFQIQDFSHVPQAEALRSLFNSCHCHLRGNAESLRN